MASTNEAGQKKTVSLIPDRGRGRGRGHGRGRGRGRGLGRGRGENNVSQLFRLIFKSLKVYQAP